MTITAKIESVDPRGEVLSVKIDDKEWLIVATKIGKHRAGHAHKKETRHIILHGKVKIHYLKEGQKESSILLRQGDIYTSEPMQYHLLQALEYSVMLEEGGNKDNTFEYQPWREIVRRDIQGS